MPTKIYWIYQFDNSARIGIMARPRGGDWLEDEITHLKKSKVRVLVSLLESDEIYELALNKEEDVCKSKGILFINFPIVDRGIPKYNIDNVLNQLKVEINNGQSVVIHCRMGIGRSSIIAAAILLYYNFKAKEIIERISSIRGLKVPDTVEQFAWLLSRQ